MNNRRMTFALVAFYAAVIFIAGCFPEDSLEWSEDGSVGLLRTKGALYLVDGVSGELTEISKEDVEPWPDISKDGKMVAYCQAVECSSLSEGLKLLPEGQVKMIEHWAGQMEKEILDSGGLVDGRFPLPEKGLLVPHDYGNWVIRYVCENADSELLEILGSEGIQKGREKGLKYFGIIVAPGDSFDNKRTVTISLFRMMRTRFSPDGKAVAYMMHTQHGEVQNAPEEFTLCVASLEEDVKAMVVAWPVAIGYDWRPDGKAIVCLEANPKNLDDELVPGILRERLVADGNDNLLVVSADTPEQGAVGTENCKGEVKDLAGTLFNPFSKVAYGLRGRIFFSSAALSLPASELDTPRWSLFCYDPATRSVANVLPSIGSDLVGGNVNLFALSPDGGKVLLMMDKNRFGIYRFSDGWGETPIEEDEGFGDVVELPPAWKGNDEISGLVSENSHFLSKPEGEVEQEQVEEEDQEGEEVQEGEEKKAGRKEIVILGADGKFLRVLSENWPDELNILISEDD